MRAQYRYAAIRARAVFNSHQSKSSYLRRVPSLSRKRCEFVKSKKHGLLRLDCQVYLWREVVVVLTLNIECR